MFMFTYVLRTIHDSIVSRLTNGDSTYSHVASRNNPRFDCFTLEKRRIAATNSAGGSPAAPLSIALAYSSGCMHSSVNEREAMRRRGKRGREKRTDMRLRRSVHETVIRSFGEYW